MNFRSMILLIILIVAGNIACRIELTCQDISVQKSDGEYHVFERGIDDVAIIVENIIPSSVGSTCNPRQQNYQGRIHAQSYKSAERFFCTIRGKIARYCISTASKPRTLYFIFALHRMRD